MKNIYIFGNWKSNIGVADSIEWMKKFSAIQPQGVENAATVVVCAPFTDLYPLHQVVIEHSLKLSLGAQDVSPFSEGAYTGEESGKMLKELVDWVIVGHSERRKYMHEDDTELAAEVKQAKAAGLKVVYCVSDETMAIPEGVDVIGYEPLWAIGTGKTDSPENANSVIQKLKDKSHVALAVYGGSITADNVHAFVQQSAIDGVLVGGASLDPEKFETLIKKATEQTA